MLLYSITIDMKALKHKWLPALQHGHKIGGRITCPMARHSEVKLHNVEWLYSSEMHLLTQRLTYQVYILFSTSSAFCWYL